MKKNPTKTADKRSVQMCAFHRRAARGKKNLKKISKLHQLVRAVLCWPLPLDGSQKDTAELH